MIQILAGDCRDLLPTLETESVHCVVTSPPYFALRDYGCDGQLGLEATPDEFVDAMVAVFREVRRVLRGDGTVWLNLGDSYAGSGKGPSSSLSGLNGKQAPHSMGVRMGSVHGESGHTSGVTPPPGFKPKDLYGIPWRVALALQADGWWLRSDIVWSKPNPMPESVADRPTRSHEYVFLLSKSRRYFYDADAVREPYKPDSVDRYSYAMQSTAPTGRQPGGDIGRKVREQGIRDPNPLGRNLRSVWTIPTQPFAEAHFATFPPALVEPCIKAGTSDRGCCPACGAGWVREVERGYANPGHRTTNGPRSTDRRHETAGFSVRLESRVETLGWHPGCACNAGEPIPATVLDPFAGAGTTLLVADRLGRDAIGLELNPEYAAMARRRVHNEAPLFAEVSCS